MKLLKLTKGFIFILLVVLFFGFHTPSVFAQESPSVLYIPLIGLTAVPDPLALPKGPGKVTYKYAVKNFLRENALTGITVVDDKCTPIKFVEGDDNGDDKLDYSETWRYSCTTKIDQTTESVATVTGNANNLNATHKSYATVVVGQKDPAPLVSIVNITKVAYPLSLPAEGGDITYTYKVNNPGVVPLGNVSVTDDKCSAMSGKLGDTNGNNLVDTNEVWIYTCTTRLTATTTNTVNVTAYANGLKAVDNYTITVHVDSDIAQSQSIPNFPNTGGNPNLKIMIWGILAGVLAVLIVVSIMKTNGVFAKFRRKSKSVRRSKSNDV